MEQIIIKKLNGEEIKIFSTDPVSFATQATQDHTLMSTDTVKISFKSTESYTIEIGDKIEIVNDTYTIRTATTREIVDEDLFFYELTFYGSIYDLLKSQYRDADATGVSYNSSFDLTYSLKDFVKVVINNVNRDYPGKWAFDEANCPDTDPILMSFSKQNCLNALQTICKEFNQDFYITQGNGIRTIHIGSTNNIINPPGGKSHFEWGKGNGLYRLKEKSVDDKSIISRLWVEGGTDNIKSNYRNYSQRLQLPLSRLNKKAHTLYDGTIIPAGSQTIGISSEARRFIEDSALSVKLGGVVEDTEHYDHIFPQRTGEVTAKPTATEGEDGQVIPADIFSFIDEEMFDLTAKDGNDNTLYLVDGVSAKLTFISGSLAGQQFEIESYDHATKTFKIIEFADSRGLKFPSDAFPIRVGDKYKLTDIVMPQLYVDEAEEDLWYAGYNDFLMRKQARVQYELTFDPMYFKETLSDDVEMSLFKPGDYIPVKDIRFDLEKNIRITNVKRNLLKDHDYVLTLSDTHTISIITETIQDVLEHEKVIIRNRLRDWSRARLAWRTTEELRNMIFDTDDFFDMGNIRPLSVDTNMLTVGVKSQQFVLIGVILQANADGLANKFNASAGQLVHLTIDPDDVRTWQMSETSVVLADLGGYYVYAKCAKDGTTGVWHITQQQLKATDISDPNNYYFQVGIIGSLHAGFTFRDFTTTYGFTRINGNTITTGRIITSDGQNYLDLDGNKFKLGDANSSFDWNVTALNQVTLKNVKILSQSGDLSDIGAYRGMYNNAYIYYPGDEVSYQHNGAINVYRQNHSAPITGIVPTNGDYWLLKTQGGTGVGISDVTEFYLATSADTGVTHYTPGWKTAPADAPLTAVNKYLWNYESVQYTDGSFVNTDPVIIGTYGKDGRGISKITEFYLASSANSGITHYTSGWQTDPALAVITPTNKYLWNYESIEYTDGTYLNTIPVIIGAYGNKGDTGDYFEYRYAKSTSTVTPPSLTNNVANPNGWTTTVPSTTTLEYVWWTMAKKSGSGDLLTNWSVPIRIKPVDGAPGAKGESPVLVYRGVYGSGITYYGTNQRVDAVKYNGQYYIARIDAGQFVGTLPSNTSKWNTFGAEFESIATNLLLAEGANIGDWFMQAGKIVSTLSTSGNKITLDASMAQILIESLSSGGDYSLDSGNSTLKFNASQGVVEARNSYGVSYISASGIFSNRPRTNALPASSGYTHYGAIVGLGFGGTVNNSWAWGSPDTLVAGVYGRSSNAGNAPHYGGYFDRLRANGLFLNTVYIHDASPSYIWLEDTATFVCGLTNTGNNRPVSLPNNGYEGQIVIAKQMGQGKMTFYARTGQYIYDDSTANSYYECTDGYMLIFVFARYSIDGTNRQIWTVSKLRF